MDDRLEKMENRRKGLDMIVRLMETFREAAPILTEACHPLSGYRISHSHRCASLGVLIADTSTIKSGEAREWIAFLEVSIYSGEKKSRRCGMVGWLGYGQMFTRVLDWMLGCERESQRN